VAFFIEISLKSEFFLSLFSRAANTTKKCLALAPAGYLFQSLPLPAERQWRKLRFASDSIGTRRLDLICPSKSPSMIM